MSVFNPAEWVRISAMALARHLHEGQRKMLLALMTNAVVVPTCFQATQPYSGMIRDFFHLNKVNLHFGWPIHFDDIAGKHRDDDSREVALKRIMDAIVALQEQSTPSTSTEVRTKREVSDGREISELLHKTSVWYRRAL